MKAPFKTILLIIIPATLLQLSCTPSDHQEVKPGPSTSNLEETPSTDPVPLDVINDCIDALQQQIPDRDIMLLSAKRGEASFIVDLAVRGVEKPWRCYHDGTRCTGTEYQGEG